MKRSSVVLALVLSALAGCSKVESVVSPVDQGPYPGHTWAWYTNPANRKESTAQYLFCNKPRPSITTQKEFDAWTAKRPACQLFMTYPFFDPRAGVPVPGPF